MSWHSGNWAATTAGLGLSTIWDVLVVANSHWTVHDNAAGVNAKVYRCYDADENVDFYVYVKDNNVGYWEVELWEGWDAVGHAGTGIGIVDDGVDVFRARRVVGGWYLSVLDHRIIYIDATNWQAQYIGAPRRYDKSKNIVLVMSATDNATYYNCLTYWTKSDSHALAQRFLFDENRNQPLVNGDGGAGSSTYRQIMGVDGVLRLAGEMPVAGAATSLAVGTLEGVADMGAGASLNFSPANGETVSIDGVDWIIFSGTYPYAKFWCAVRMA